MLNSAEETLLRTLAQRLRDYRESSGMTLQELADRSGVSRSMISKIEHSDVLPSLATLARLAESLSIPVAGFLRGIEEQRDALFVPSGEGLNVSLRYQHDLGGNQKFRVLGSGRGVFQIYEPLHVEITELPEPPIMYQHPGVEFIYVLSGEFEFAYGQSMFKMSVGDSLEFEAEVLHGCKRVLAGPAEYLSIRVFDRTLTNGD